MLPSGQHGWRVYNIDPATKRRVEAGGAPKAAGSLRSPAALLIVRRSLTPAR